MTELGGVGVRNRVMGQDLAAETRKVPHDLPANGPRAVDADGFVAELETFQSLQFEVAFADPLISAGNPARHGEKQGQSELRNGVGGVGGDGGDGDPEFLGGGEVDVVGAGAEGGDQPGAAPGEDLETSSVHTVVHEDKGGVITSAKGCRGGVQLGFEEFQLVSARGVFGFQGGFRIASRTENQRLHVVRLPSDKRESESGEGDAGEGLSG